MQPGRMTDAEGVLKQGYETTGSEVLLQNYCATVLNEVVKAVNENRAGISEISRCVDVLEADPDNADAPEICRPVSGASGTGQPVNRSCWKASGILRRMRRRRTGCF